MVAQGIIATLLLAIGIVAIADAAARSPYTESNQPLLPLSAAVDWTD